MESEICLLTFAYVLLCLYAKQTQFPKSQKDVSDYILRVYENIHVFGQQKTKQIKHNFINLSTTKRVDRKSEIRGRMGDTTERLVDGLVPLWEDKPY